MRPSRKPAFGLTVATLGVFFTALDQTVVVTAIPEMVVDLGIDFQDIDRAAWIVTGFLIGYAVALPIAGRLADHRSKRLVYLTALALFAAASLVAALASNLWLLVAARVVQAAGGGALVPVAMAYAGEVYGGRKRAIALGLVVAAAEAGGVVGPLWGAAVTHFFSWRWIFYVNLPVTAIIAAAVWRAVPARAGPRVGLDWPGVVLATAGLGLLTTGLARDQGVPAVASAALIALGAAALGAFLLVELRARVPLIDVKLFARREFAAGNVAAVLVGGGLIIPMVNVPLFAATVLELDTLAGGLLLLKMTALIPVGAAVGGILAARAGDRTAVILGAITAAAGLWLASGWHIEPGEARLTRDLMIAGFGFGLLIPPLAGAVMGAAGTENAGMAAGLVTVSRLIGMMVALAALTPWAVHRFNNVAANIPLPLGRGGESQQELTRLAADYQVAVARATAGMFNDLFLVGAMLCAVAAVPAIFLAGRRSQKLSVAQGS